MKAILKSYSSKPSRLFTWILVIYSFGYIPLLILQIILNLLGLMPVNYNDQDIFGGQAVMILILFSPLIVILFTIMTWLNMTLGFLVIKMVNKVIDE